MEKTNVMRILEQNGVAYTAHSYPHGKEAVEGTHVAQMLGQNPEYVYKTLVARGKSGSLFVFDIPVAEELDLKKAAKAVGEKSVELIAVKELLPCTGYIRGGCSPLGMKKSFPTVFHELAEILPTIFVSAGKIGLQIECNPADLIGLVGASTADLVKD